MSVIRANFGELLEPGLAHVFFNELDRWDDEWDKILKDNTSSKSFEEDLMVVGLGIMGVKDEGTTVSYEDISQGYVTRYTHSTFSKAIRISQEMYEDDMYGVMRDMTGALARSAMQRQEVDAANILNRAFSTSYAGTDGAALISSSHTLSIGGTQSNAMSANADLSPAALQEAISVLEKCLDEKGLNIAMRAKKLIVPVDLQFLAMEILQSDGKQGTTDNDMNSIKGKGLELVINHYLTDTDAWFVVAEEAKLNRFTRMPLDFFKGSDFDTDDCKFKARMRYSTGFSDWRGIVGNAGA